MQTELLKKLIENVKKKIIQTKVLLLNFVKEVSKNKNYNEK